MGSGIHEWPLMFFTTIGQSVAGAFIVMAAVLLSGKLSPELNRKVALQHVRPVGADGRGFPALHDAHGYTAARV